MRSMRQRCAATISCPARGPTFSAGSAGGRRPRSNIDGHSRSPTTRASEHSTRPGCRRARPLACEAERAGHGYYGEIRQRAKRYRHRSRGGHPVIERIGIIGAGAIGSVAGKHRTLGCVITISAGMYEPGHAMRTDTAAIGFKIGEHDGRDTPRARELAEIMNAVAESKVTTNLFGERWSKLAINCMANPLAGLTGLGTLQVRTDPAISAVGVHVGAECIMVGRAAGYEVEPIYGISAQRLVDAYQGRGLA